MPLSRVDVEGYRSLRSLHFATDRLSVFIGRNGVGKTNLYHAPHLLQCAAAGGITRVIVSEGGIESARLIAGAARRSQLWVVTHPTALGNELGRLTGIRPQQVTKRDGATRIGASAPP